MCLDKIVYFAQVWFDLSHPHGTLLSSWSAPEPDPGFPFLQGSTARSQWAKQTIYIYIYFFLPFHSFQLPVLSTTLTIIKSFFRFF